MQNVKPSRKTTRAPRRYTKQVSVNIWQVPCELRDQLKARAQRSGLSLSAYLRVHLIREFGDDGR